MRRLVPIILALAGLAGGVAAGLALRPGSAGADAAAGADAVEGEGSAGADDAAATTAQVDAQGGSGAAAAHREDDADGTDGPEFVKLNNQFVVPVVREGLVRSLVVLSISLEVAPGTRETVFATEPKLRDAFLRVLFDHATAGGFDGAFTSPTNLRTLRMSLSEAAHAVLGSRVSDVLITEMVRQDT